MPRTDSMYQGYFGLAAPPFSIAPDPRYLYLSQRHQEALAHLLYGVNGGGGFVLLTGEVGSGKTTICRCFLEQIPPSCDVAYIFNPKLSVAELLSSICVEFGIPCPPGNPSIKEFVDAINAYLLAAHAQDRHTVLIIDEAQNLSAEVLEQMRLLTNLETNEKKLLQIILLGQPELATMLERPELRQLAQRIVARYHLGPLTRTEVAAYVRHRLEVAGLQRPLFPPMVLRQLYRLSKGIPRVINVLCDRALLGAYVQGRERVNHATLRQAAREVFGEKTGPGRSLVRPLLAILALTAGSALAVAAAMQDLWTTRPEPPVMGRPAVPVKPVAAPGPVAALPETLEWPDKEPRARNRPIAQAALFRAWGADYREGDACRQAGELGLRCQSARGALDELRQLNRPAILQMSDEQGGEFDATLTGLDAQSATFTIGTETRTVGLGALARQWSGHYMLLWRASPAASEKIRPGQRGPAVDELDRQLGLLEGRGGPTNGDAVFDETLVQRLKQFQLAHGLVPDGAPGPKTLMRLSGAADQAAPRLVRAPGGK